MKAIGAQVRSVIPWTCLILLALFSQIVVADDIPADITLQIFVKPDGQRLHLIVRVPLSAMRDVSFPLRGPGYLELDQADPLLRAAATNWIAGNVVVYEGVARLPAPHVAAVVASLPSDKSFTSYALALAHVTTGGLPSNTNLYWNEGLLDALLEYPISSDRSEFSIQPALARLGIRVVTVLRFVTPDGRVHAFEYLGDPGLVRLDPRWHQAALRFVRLGFDHILHGTDHLLFLLCLVIPFRRFRQLVLIVTSFTVAHSITLIASAMNVAPGGLWFPPLIETLIAASIVFMAFENIVLSVPSSPSSGVPRLNVRRRWMLTFGFGLVHGFGFSFALRKTLQFGGSHLLTSLLSFNLGVELGQILVLALMIPILQALFRFVVAERIGTIILSALVAHTAWHWTLDRGDRLRAYAWPAPDTLFLVWAVRGLIVAVMVAGAIWVWGFARRVGGPKVGPPYVP